MTRRGLVIARHRRDFVIESDDGRTMNALAGGRQTRPLTGDEILWHEAPDGTAVIEEILPRRSLLERIDSRGLGEGVAANVSRLIVVVAPSPTADWQLVDRYLVAAELMRVGAALVRNKADVDDAALDERALSYGTIGYDVVTASAKTGRGIAALAALLDGERGVLVGQSGVGKSSLLNALLESEAQAVGDLSRRRALGRHTTTAAVLHRLPGGGELIDSPGVRRYAPSIEDTAALPSGFVEFAAVPGRCRFNDCSHVDEPECAVRGAVAAGAIDPRRYESYVALRAAVEALRARSDASRR